MNEDMSSIVRPPPLPLSSLLTVIKTYFPFIEVQNDSYKEFVAYDDRNYYFKGSCLKERGTCNISRSFQKVYITSPNEYVLKVINHQDAADGSGDVLTGLSALLKYLCSCGFNCPLPIRSITEQDFIPISKSTYLNFVSGNPVSASHELAKERYSLQLLTFIPGELLSDITNKASLLFKFGHYLGSMDKELQSFSHTGFNNRKLTDWNLQYLLSLQNKAASIFKTSESKLFKVQYILRQFKESVISVLPNLRQSIIHGDGNDMNVVVHCCDNGEYEVNGMIDFSDCIKAPTVFNLGIAMSYNMLDMDDPVTYIVPFLMGYNNAFSLYKEEMDILYYIVMGRLAQSCINGEYSYSQDPTNEYVMTSVKASWKLIDQLLSTDKVKCDEIWRLTNN